MDASKKYIFPAAPAQNAILPPVTFFHFFLHFPLARRLAMCYTCPIMTEATTPKHASPPNVVVAHGKSRLADLDKGHFVVVKPRATKPTPNPKHDAVMRNWHIGSGFSEAIAAVVRQELGREIERITRSVIRAMVDSGDLSAASLGIVR